MASRCYAEQHIALVNHLLAKKDRLILEKDELVASKDRMWRELSAIVLERDAEISRLRHASLSEASKSASRPEPSLADMDEEIKGLKQRNAALEQALRDLLDDPCDEADGKAFESDTDRSEDIGVKTDGGFEDCGSHILIEHYSDLPVNETAGNEWRGHPASVVTPTFARQSWSAGSVRTASSRTLQASHSSTTNSMKRPTASFTFRPLIDTSVPGSRELGDVEEVAPSVLQSVNEQVELHLQRVLAEASVPSPSPQFCSTGCMWHWMHNSATNTIWTTDRTHDFACATCFD